MQIVVNTRLLLKNRLEGIGWFSYQTLKRITQNHPEVHFIFLFDRACDETFIFGENVTPLVLGPQARHPFLYHAWFQFSVKNLLNRLKPDLFLSPDGFIALGASCRQLAVIHDINFLKYPKDLKWLTGKYYNHFFPKFAKTATRIATVSQYSKNEIVTNYRIAADKIDVVYNGINDFFKPLNETYKTEIKNKYTQGKNYFVFVGSLHPRKNIVNLLKAFALFKKESGSDLMIVLAGPAYWGLKEIKNTIEENNLRADLVFTGRLPDEELAGLVGSALALTFIPYYEGFGIPLVEAMAAQIPIITANVTSLPEIAGDAALLVDPFDIVEIKEAMLKIYQDQNLSKTLVEKGITRRQDFSWNRSADLLWQSVLKTLDTKNIK